VLQIVLSDTQDGGMRVPFVQVIHSRLTR